MKAVAYSVQRFLIVLVVCSMGLHFLNSGAIMAKSTLQQYKSKRDFKKSPEPKPTKKSSAKKNIFVIQKHHARSLHYDFRLESEGVLKSWAVPKGPSLNPRDKRLAVQVEDHPLGYAMFEGIIPEGYGAGTVIVWDKGTYKNTTEKHGERIPFEEALEAGHVEIELKGKKLKGLYALTRFRGENNWLLVKVDDEYADARRDPVADEPNSVLSKKTIEKLDKKFEKLKKERVSHG
jgi:DNA ligase D-like protein (predicted 3'-phosphoesterase)